MLVKLYPKILPLLLILQLPLCVQALSLKYEREVSSSFFSDALGVRDSWLEQDNWAAESWNLKLSRSQSKDSSTGQELLYTTQELSGGMGFRLNQSWSADVSAYGARAPETKYSDSGFDLGLSYFYEFLPNSAKANKELDEDSSEAFTPWMSLGLSIGSGTTRQQINFEVLGQPRSRDVEVGQRSWGFNFTIQPWELFSANIDFVDSIYDVDRSQLSRITSSQLINRLAGDLISTIGGLSDYSYGVSGHMHISESLDLNLAMRRTVLLVDQSEIDTLSITGTYSAQNWIMDLGFRRVYYVQDGHENPSVFASLGYSLK